MKKNKCNILSLALLFTSIVFTSCNNDDAQDDSVVNVNNGAASVVAVSSAINVDGVSTINEGGIDTEYTYSVVMNKVQPVDVYVNVSLLPGGDAVEGDDFDFDHQIRIPAYSTTGTGTVTLYGDGVDEATESFTLQVGNVTDANISLEPKELAFNITDFGDLNLTFSFDKSFDFAGSTYSLCSLGYDMDFYLFNSDGVDALEDYQAATGNCTEAMTLSLADLEDGEYELIQNVYGTGPLAPGLIVPAFDIPVTVGYTRDNSTFAGTITQDASDVINSDFAADPGLANPVYIATVTISNGIYTFSQNGQFVASGRMSKIKNQIRNRVAKPVGTVNVPAAFRK